MGTYRTANLLVDAAEQEDGSWEVTLPGGAQVPVSDAVFRILFEPVGGDGSVKSRRGRRGPHVASDEVTVREAARMLGVHENTVRNYTDAGLLQFRLTPTSVQGKGFRRILRTSVEALMKSRHEEH